jgi:hypothetical protein
VRFGRSVTKRNLTLFSKTLSLVAMWPVATSTNKIMKSLNMRLAEDWAPGLEGIFLGLDAEKYHKAPGVSHSMCKNAEPPARLPVYLAEKFEPTTAMIMGTLTHQRILEPGKPMPSLAIKPEKMTFASSDGKAWREAQKGKVIVKETDFEAIIGMVDSVVKNETARRIFEQGESEVSLFCHCQRPDLLLKARLDFVPAGDCLVDIKTTKDGGGSADEFAKTVYDMRYFSQAAHYLDTWNDLCGETHYKRWFIFIVVEKVAPYLVSLFKFSVNDNAIELGRRLNRKNQHEIALAQASGIWPGYPDKLQTIYLPGWAENKLGEQLDYVG